jgi:hypothetical protein
LRINQHSQIAQSWGSGCHGLPANQDGDEKQQ